MEQNVVFQNLMVWVTNRLLQLEIDEPLKTIYSVLSSTGNVFKWCRPISMVEIVAAPISLWLPSPVGDAFRRFWEKWNFVSPLLTWKIWVKLIHWKFSWLGIIFILSLTLSYKIRTFVLIIFLDNTLRGYDLQPGNCTLQATVKATLPGQSNRSHMRWIRLARGHMVVVS